ncbi:MAG TPA: hypothetical protein PLE75_07620 [Ferruginibacter sp.]|nr:hypothetical protein [Ferruginibacter sp.]HRO06536.1 hypothetical protein [Ferruginibacter sp.]HRO95439.1 hypothetical protein [Ferruginibacter sp.]HRP49975.1 hypothetical protein [Ferruginibacter sp.]
MLTCLIAANVTAQTKDSLPAERTDTAFQQVLQIPGNFSRMEVDALGHIYLLEQGLLKKYTATGDSLSVYNDVRRFGNPTIMDVSNPLKTLLFFKNFTTVVVLDRMLSQRATLNLRKMQIFAARSACISYDNEIWVLDEQDFKLKKINENGQLLLESNDLRLITDHAVKADQITDHNGFVYLYDKSFGFTILDRYGAFKGTLAFPGMHSLSFTSNSVYGFNNHEMSRLDLNLKISHPVALPQVFAQASSVRVVNPYIYLLTESGVSVYRLPE